MPIAAVVDAEQPTSLMVLLESSVMDTDYPVEGLTCGAVTGAEPLSSALRAPSGLHHDHVEQGALNFQPAALHEASSSVDRVIRPESDDRFVPPSVMATGRPAPGQGSHAPRSLSDRGVPGVWITCSLLGVPILCRRQSGNIRVRLEFSARKWCRKLADKCKLPSTAYCWCCWPEDGSPAVMHRGADPTDSSIGYRGPHHAVHSHIMGITSDG